MASFLQILFFISFLLTSISVSAIDDITSSTSTFFSSTATTQLPPPPPPFSLFTPLFSPFSLITPILTDLGFNDLAMAAHSLSLSSSAANIPWLGPTTIFAPVDSAVRTCPSCSLSLLLQEHTVPGLYPADYLRKLAFGTRIETILPGRCLTVTSSVNSAKFFVGGAEITKPDLFSNGHVIVHGLRGFVSHLSLYSCSIDKLTSLSLPPPSIKYVMTKMMLADAMIRLRTGGYSILALALRVKFPELAVLDNMTVFALDDAAIFHGGGSYIRDVRFHIVPNLILKVSDLERLPAATALPTLVTGERLKVTTSGGGGVLSPMRINYVRIKSPDLLYNMKMVVHGLSLPFPRLRQSSPLTVSAGRSGFHHGGAEQLGFEEQEDPSEVNLGRQTVPAPSPVIDFTVEMDYHHGL